MERKATQYARQHRAIGLCVHCSSPVVEGRSRCAKHLNAAVKRQITLYHKRIRSGLCVAAGCSNPPEPGKRRCRLHLDNVVRLSAAIEGASRAAVFAHYGKRCACCGERDRRFLTVDHENGGGNTHRRQVGNRIHVWLYRQFKSTGAWPTGYRILCYNCNCASYRNGGVCPHKEAKWKAA